MRIPTRIIRKEVVFIAIFALALTGTGLFVIHYYVDWKFLWGGDQVPILYLDGFLHALLDIKTLWQDLGVLFVPQLSIIFIDFFYIKR